MLNDENWKRVHALILKLDKVGFRTFEHFKKLASHGHHFDDDMLFEAVSVAVNDHQEFKSSVGDLHNQIRAEDFERLRTLHKYLIVVLLDVARTQEERIEKQERMEKHFATLQEHERAFKGMTAEFVQPFIARPRPDRLIARE